MRAHCDQINPPYEPPDQIKSLPSISNGHDYAAILFTYGSMGPNLWAAVDLEPKRNQNLGM